MSRSPYGTFRLPVTLNTEYYHPALNSTDGVFIAGFLRHQRIAVRVMANHFLAPLSKSITWLRQAGILDVFPANAVSSADPCAEPDKKPAAIPDSICHVSS